MFSSLLMYSVAAKRTINTRAQSVGTKTRLRAEAPFLMKPYPFLIHSGAQARNRVMALKLVSFRWIFEFFGVFVLPVCVFVVIFSCAHHTSTVC
jgi:hypothetical protein